jgi:hypothetical protein
MASKQIRAPGSKPGENMLWGGRFTGWKKEKEEEKEIC